MPSTGRRFILSSDPSPLARRGEREGRARPGLNQPAANPNQAPLRDGVWGITLPPMPSALGFSLRQPGRPTTKWARQGAERAARVTRYRNSSSSLGLKNSTGNQTSTIAVRTPSSHESKLLPAFASPDARLSPRRKRRRNPGEVERDPCSEQVING